MKQDKIDEIVKMCENIIKNAKAGKINVLCGVCICDNEFTKVLVAQSDVSDTTRALIIMDELMKEMQANVKASVFAKKPLH